MLFGHGNGIGWEILKENVFRFLNVEILIRFNITWFLLIGI